MARSRIAAVAAIILLMAAVCQPGAQARELLQAPTAGAGAAAASSASSAVDAGQSAGTAAASAGTAAGAQPGTAQYPPNYWWGTPKELYTDPKYSYQVYKQGNQYYYKPLNAKTPYYWIVKYYGGGHGPLYLSRSKNGKELGQVSPKGPDGSTYGYYFDSSYSGKYYINDYYQYDAGSYYYQPPYNAYLQLDFT